MKMYFFNKSEELVQVANNFIEAHLVEQINTASQLTFSLKKPLPAEIQKACVPSPNGDGFLMFKILTEDIKGSTIEYTCIESAYDELASYGYIKDLRPSARQARYMLDLVLKETRWELGLIYNTGNMSTNFYYEPILNCIQDIVKLFGLELTFTVSIEGNKIATRRVNMYRQQGNRTGKRFEYGSNALDVERETSTDELYTALVGRGKGEEVDGDNNPDTPDGYGRRITFEDIEWKKSAGDPLDKPKGQEYLEDPDATKTYGFDNGKPRIGLVEFEDDEDKDVLIQHTYQKLQELKRPKVQFKASVIDVGDCTLGDTVAIIRHDFHLEYMTRVFKIDHDLLDEHNNTVELGDDLSSQDITNRINDISNTLNQNTQQISYVMTSADGQHKVNYSPNQPANAKNGDLWYKDLGNGETELYIYNDGWQLVVSTEHQREIDDAIEEAQKDTEAAKKLAQSGVDKANAADKKAQQGIDDAAKALDDANVVSKEVTELKGGSTATLAQLENGLKQTVSNGDFESYRAETAQLIQDKVSNADFATYRTQTDQAIQDRVTSTDFESRVTQLNDQITSIVTDTKTQDYNLIANGVFNNSRIDNWRVGQADYKVLIPNGNQPFANNFIRLIPSGTGGNLDQDIPTPARLKINDWNLNFWFLAESGATGYANVYLIVDYNDGTKDYLGNTRLYAGESWQRFEIPIHKENLANVKSAKLRFNLESGSGGYWYFSQIQINPGLTAKPYTENTENMAVSSQITQLSNDINLRVAQGDVVNQINISPESILIDGKKVHITGKTSIDDAVITSAMIKDIKADQITAGTLNAANVNLINVNVNSLVGNITNFVRSGWNSVSSFTSIDGNGVTIGADSGNIKLGKFGIDFIGLSNGVNIGEMHSNHRSNSTNRDENGLMIGLNKNADYFALAYRSDDSNPLSFRSELEWNGNNGLNGRGWHFFDDINLHENYINLGASNTQTFLLTTFGYNKAQYPAILNKDRNAGILFGSDMLYAVLNGQVYSFQPLIK